MAGFGRFVQLTRNFSTTAVRNSHFQQQGIPGVNLPFNINAKYKMTAYFVIYFTSGLTAPLLIVRKQLLQ